MFFICPPERVERLAKAWGVGVVLQNKRGEWFVTDIVRAKSMITIRLDEDSVGYFKGISEQLGIPYQSLINLYLRDCAAHHCKKSRLIK